MRVTGDSLVWPGGVLTRLNDGALQFGADLFPTVPPETLPSPIILPVHAFLLQRPGSQPLLIDTGEGHGVAAALARIGVARGDIGTVAFTHLHGDHRGGYMAGGYETAQVCLSAAEADYWDAQDHPANQVMDRAADRGRRVQDGEDLAPGVRVWALPGHTPGHIGLIIDNCIAVVGDLLHRADLQLPDPGLSTRYDVDPALAIATRRAALETIAARGLVVCGGHLRLPGQEAAEDGAGFVRLSAVASGWQARAA